MNNIENIKKYLTEASAIEENEMPEYIVKEIDKLSKILKAPITINKNNIHSGIHGIITGLIVRSQKGVGIRLDPSQLSKIAKLKGLRWISFNDDTYIFTAWEHKG